MQVTQYAYCSLRPVQGFSCSAVDVRFSFAVPECDYVCMGSAFIHFLLSPVVNLDSGRANQDNKVCSMYAPTCALVLYAPIYSMYAPIYALVL